MRTVAFGMLLPLGSVTIPVIVARSARWARSSPAKNSRAEIRKRRRHPGITALLAACTRIPRCPNQTLALCPQRRDSPKAGSIFVLIGQCVKTKSCSRLHILQVRLVSGKKNYKTVIRPPFCTSARLTAETRGLSSKPVLKASLRTELCGGDLWLLAAFHAILRHRRRVQAWA